MLIASEQLSTSIIIEFDNQDGSSEDPCMNYTHKTYLLFVDGKTPINKHYWWQNCGFYVDIKQLVTGTTHKHSFLDDSLMKCSQVNKTIRKIHEDSSQAVDIPIFSG